MKQPRRNKSSSDNLCARATKTITKNKLNPFEVQVSKEKFTVLNRSTHQRHNPGAVRAKDNAKRNTTLGEEYKLRNKQNSFSDRRYEKFSATGNLSQHAKKRSVYNLNEDEILTHKGQTLAEIKKYDDTREERDDSDDENAGKLDDKFTAAAHFGGGDLDESKSRKTVIEELIADSKKRKIDRMKDAEELVEMTKKLDESWKSLIPLVGKFTKGDEVKPKPDDYDRRMREMIFERRGVPTEKLKSEEHLAQKENERLMKLERDRLSRMRGEVEAEAKPTHRSADDLDDDYFSDAGDEIDEPERMIAYEINENAAKDEEYNGDDDHEENGTEFSHKSGNDNEENGEDEEDDDEKSDGEDSNEEDSEGESSDNLSDLKIESSSDDEDDEEESEDVNKSAEVVEESQKEEEQQPAVNGVIDKKEEMDNAAKELPYTFIVPESYDEFLKLLQSHRQASVQRLIIERMLKSNHPRLSNINYGKVATMFAYMLQYINDLFSEANASDDLENSFKVFAHLTPSLFDICQLNAISTGKCFEQVVIEKYTDFKEGIQKRYPDLDTIIYFKLVSILYSTSDFRHPIVTPTMCFINHILSRCAIRTCADISSGLLIMTFVHEYTQLSKRFLPSAFNFLNGCLTLCVPKRAIEVVRIIPPFKSISLLVLEDISLEFRKTWDKKSNDHLKIQPKDFLKNSKIDDDYKVRAMFVILGLIYDFIDLLSTNSGVSYLVAPFVENIEKLETMITNYPKSIQEQVAKISSLITKVQTETKLCYIMEKEKKPKPLRMLEPRVVKVYDGGRKHHSSEAKAQREKMMYKIRRETKGAMREIRKDNEFLAKLQLKKRIQSDNERKQKVRRIFAEASTQQSEFKAFDRAKKHKNKL